MLLSGRRISRNDISWNILGSNRTFGVCKLASVEIHSSKNDFVETFVINIKKPAQSQFVSVVYGKTKWVN